MLVCPAVAASFWPNAQPIKRPTGLEKLGGVFFGFPHVTWLEREVKFHVLSDKRSEMLCWTDWNNPPRPDTSGCGHPNSHPLNILNLCEELSGVMRRRPARIVVGTYFHPSTFSHPWFRRHDALVRRLYALPLSPPMPRTAVMHLRRCFVDPPHDFFANECGPRDPHFYPSLPSAYYAAVLRHYAASHTLAAAVTPECRFSPKIDNLRALFPSLGVPSGAALKTNDQRGDLVQMMSAGVFVADVGSFSAWIAYLRGLLYPEAVNHVPLFDVTPPKYGRPGERSFDAVPAQLVDSAHFAALGVAPATVYHLVNRVPNPADASPSWFLQRRGVCTPFAPASLPEPAEPEPHQFNASASVTLTTGKSPCRPSRKLWRSAGDEYMKGHAMTAGLRVRGAERAPAG